MLDDEEIEAELAWFGLDEHSYRALALLPLVRVAWADGRVSPAERDRLLELAQSRFGLQPEGARVLRNWLVYPPSDDLVASGTELLVSLSVRSRAASQGTLVDLVDMSEDIARAGVPGFLSWFRPIRPGEQKVVRQIALELGRGDVSPDVPHAPRRVRPTSPRPQVSVASLGVPGRDGKTWFPLLTGGLVVGTGSHCHVQLAEDSGASPEHCKLVEHGGRYYVVDKDSARGTIVNGERVVERRLFGGEELVLGTAALQFAVP